jgi:phage baseplate assembly protein gpV
MSESGFTDGLTSLIDAFKPKFYGVAVGRVSSDSDPLMLGRVQLTLPFLDSSDSSPWARVAVPMVGSSVGSYFIPANGDDVLVAFEHGDVNAPYVIGSLWSSQAPPPYASPSQQMRTIHTPNGNEITFNDLVPTITIKTPNGQTVELSSTGVTVKSGGGKIEIVDAPPSVKISSGSNVIEMKTDGMSISASPNLSITATGELSITGSIVRINS